MSAPSLSTSTTDPTLVTQLIGENDDLKAELKRVSAERDAIAARLKAAEQAIRDTQDGYRHIIYDLRGRIVGTLTGRMERLLSTALEAARADTPRVAVIIERIEIVTEMLAAFVQQERNPKPSHEEHTHHE